MLLQGSCHCGAVSFTVNSHSPQPYQRCYCSICRKAGGAGGFAINIIADNETKQVIGQDQVAEYRAVKGGQLSHHRRYFCRQCGSHLWAWNESCPELVHPLAAVVDTHLPKPSHFVDIMLDSAVPWVELHAGDYIERFADLPDQSIEAWRWRHSQWLD
jgi:hypothetical protein